MPTLLQINVTANWGSTGKIAEDIGKLAIEAGWDSWIAYGRGNPTSQSNLIRIGNDWDMRIHGLQSRLFDNHGLASKKVTEDFIHRIKEINPDIIHLHNIHGYYLNYQILFRYLKEYDVPIIWTLHDCWPFTGHCAYYDFAKCSRWQTECHDCPQLKSYPASLWRDRSTKNFFTKKDSFLGCRNLTFVPVSDWLNGELKKSFLSGYPAVTIHNGIDLSVFTPAETVKEDSTQKIILGVASVWDKRKGLEEFVRLRKLLPENYHITLVGLSNDQISTLPDGITGIRRTENVRQLADLYSMADVFVNPTLEDNFPTTNLEALACGTPVITYRTGGSPEAIDDTTGFIVDYQDVEALARQIVTVCETNAISANVCRKRAENFYNKKIVFQQYISLYNHLLQQ
ncbi:glycosyltransferase [Bacteroides acidifaciens]|uniref:glycosyltransferase n=1 Tax=Bacteroides acidifaciens TaxID=85831 RepID=UPI0025A9A2B8|nr:glycosyltransferase [Bacteroides acidifaciens]